MNTTIRCPFCEQEYEIENFKEGSEVECAKCKNSFTLETFLITDKLAKQQIEATLKQQNVKEIAEVNTNKQNYTHPSNPSKSFSEKQFEEEFKKPILARVLNILAIISAIASILFFLALLGEILFNVDRKYSLLPNIISLITSLIYCIVNYGIAELITYIGEIRFNSIKQTQILLKIGKVISKR